MSEQCKQYEEELMDVFYLETGIRAELEEHLQSCSHCKNFYASLQHTQTELNEIMTAADWMPEANEESLVWEARRAVNTAFNVVETINAQRKVKKDLVLFVCLSILLIAMGGCLVYMGWGMMILVLQCTAFLIAPMMVLFFFKRLKKEGY